MFDFSSDLLPAPRQPKKLSQDEKCRRLAELMIVEFARNRECSLDRLRDQAKAAGLSSRIELQFGPGVGGAGGLNLFRSAVRIEANRDNLLRLIRLLGEPAVIRLLDTAGFDEAAREEFARWVNNLQRAIV